MPAVEIDLGGAFAGWQMVAVMLWPHDKLARDDFLVTTAAQLIQKVEEIPQNLAAQLAATTDYSVEEVKARIESRAKGRIAATVSSLYAEIDNELFRPSGGYGRIAAAGGIDAIGRAAREGGRTFGAACGELLVYIVTLVIHHRNVSASLNRATHIMVERAKKEGRTIPGERDRKTMWTRWGGIAPLWAASVFCQTTARAQGSNRMTYHDPEYRQEVISASLWLADFAVKFTPTGAKAPLLSENKVIRLNCKLPAVRPEIPPLTDEQLAWARAYRAPIPLR